MIEMEAKMQVGSFNPIRYHLDRLGGYCLGTFMCFERYFDKSDGSLVKEGKSLRLRWSADVQKGSNKYILTVKGPLIDGALKAREEHEVEFNENPQEAIKLLAILGYQQTIAFDKKRETWQVGNCKVELDQISQIGHFVEIEGPSEAEIMALRAELSLQDTPLILQSYASMVADWSAKNKI